MGAKPVFGLVSREGIEPSTRGLKVPCSATELPALFREDFSRWSMLLTASVAAGEPGSDGKRGRERRPDAPASATRDTLTTAEKYTSAIVTSSNSAAA